MAKQSQYKSLKEVSNVEVLEGLTVVQRVADSQTTKRDQLKEQAKACEEAITKSDNKIAELIRAVRDNKAVYRLKSGELTTDPPDAQQDLPGTAE